MRLARLLIFATIVFVSSAAPALEEVSMSDLPKYAIEHSQLTLPGSRPFHIKLQVVETTNLENDDYKGEIDEYWVAPDKWRRTVKTPSFSQTLIVNGDKVDEQRTGSYYPNWMRTLVRAALDPGATLEGVDLTQANDNPRIGGDPLCRRFKYRVGQAPASNSVFASYCFRNGLLDSVGKPGYSAAYSDYREFGNKRVAYQIREHIESGTELGASIVELAELKKPDDSLFEVHQQTAQLQTVQVSEETLRGLAINPPEMRWPPVRGGKTAGVLSLYVCTDLAGHTQEVYELNSDHPEMADAAREQMTNWTFKPAVIKGNPVQAEGIVTFAYETKIDDPYPVLSNEDARKRAIKLVEPHFPESTARGTIVSVRVLVSEEGRVMTIGNISGCPLGPIVAVVEQWRFQPYLRDGKPTDFNADLTFTVK